MAELIDRDKLIKELNKLAANQTEANIMHGIHAAVHLVEIAPEVSPCTGCQKEQCKWRH